MLSKSADPSLATPSQAPRGEGVETGWEPPERVTAKVKAQSRPRTLGRSGGGESRSGMGSGESWFEPRRGNSEPDVATHGVGLRVSRRDPPELARGFTVGRAPQVEPSPASRPVELYDRPQGFLVWLLISEHRTGIPPRAGHRDVLERQVLPFRR